MAADATDIASSSRGRDAPAVPELTLSSVRPVDPSRLLLGGAGGSEEAEVDEGAEVGVAEEMPNPEDGAEGEVRPPLPPPHFPHLFFSPHHNSENTPSSSPTSSSLGARGREWV